MDLVFITLCEMSRYQNTTRSGSGKVGELGARYLLIIIAYYAYLLIAYFDPPPGIFPVQTPWPWPWLRLAPWSDTGGEGSRNKQISRNGPSFHNF